MNDKKQGPLGPIVRKKKDEPAPSLKTAEAKPEEAKAEATPPAPEPKPEPKPLIPEKKVDTEGLNLGRRVVDPKTTAPVRKSEPVIETTVEQASMEDFEAMLAESGMGEPQRVSFSVGDKVAAHVVNIGDKYVYFELPGRAEALSPIAEFQDKEGALTLAEGDSIDVYVTDTRSGIQVGRKLSSREFASELIEQAFASGVPIEGRVTGTNKGGFEVEIQGVRAFCPMSQIELGFTEEPDVHVGNSYLFRVTKYGEDGRNVVVSRTAILEEERKVAAEKTLATLGEGMNVDGIVTRLADFGAFVDIGGVEGLIHISELGHRRVDHPSEVLKEGQQVTVKILSMKEDRDGLRIGLSIKETLEDPWESGVSNFVEGQKVTGTVSRLEPFGAFVELAPGLEGLVHVSEMSWEKHVKHPKDVVSVGEQVQVEIQSLDIVRQRIGLSMKGAGKDPWSAIDENFAVGLEVSGTIENVEDFGVFVSLKGGITALIPRSEMGLESGATPHRKFSKGNEITARVLSIEPERRRMALTLKSESEMAEATERANAPRSYSDSDSGGFGTFGDLFKDKLK